MYLAGVETIVGAWARIFGTWPQGVEIFNLIDAKELINLLASIDLPELCKRFFLLGHFSKTKFQTFNCRSKLSNWAFLNGFADLLGLE